MMRRCLPECDCAGSVSANLPAVCFAGSGYLRQNFLAINAWRRGDCLEHDCPADNFTAEGPNHADRCNLPSHLVAIEIRRAAHIHAAIRHIESALGIFREIPQAPAIGCNDLMGLAANSCHALR